MMKLADYVFRFIAERNIKQVFVLPGGGCIHLCDSLGRNDRLEYIPLLHEQAISIAVEAYGQHANSAGVGLVTSGPGATNAVTGVTAGWIDSTPMMIISGQAKTEDLIGDKGVRQIGSQEVQIIPMVKHITKYAATVLDPTEIRDHLEKAFYLAENGRKGPVWLEIPLDIQAAMIDEDHLVGYTPEDESVSCPSTPFDEIMELLSQSKRPLVLAGNGIKLSGCESKFYEFIKKARIPALATWKAIDLFDYDDELFFGCPGLLGQRSSNFILQNADLLIVLGSRLDFSLTAYNNPNFAKSAKKIIVDIDGNEIKKLQDMEFAVEIASDLCRFFDGLDEFASHLPCPDRSDWLQYCAKMKNQYPSVTSESYADHEFVNTYAFMDTLSNHLNHDDVIVPESSGNAGEVTYQAIRIKKGQKMKNAAGLGSMGFGLPYAIGACIANDGRRTVLINGDGAFHLNIQELASVVSQKLPIKIFIWNNQGYATIMATQRNLFDANYVACECNSKLHLPDIVKIAKAYGLTTFEMNTNDEIDQVMREVFNTEGPVLCNVRVSPRQTVSPRVQSMKLPDGKMASMPLENMWPYLDPNEIEENMCS